jgi:peptidoglycan/LPS O-acetylase OafA/YrhL
MRSGYFTEIDSLRAVAVLLVIANHYIPKAAKFGYLGVDIFFVISGFVITHQLKSLKYKSLYDALLNYYVRRLARLAPVLLSVIVLCFITFSLLTPHPQNFFKTGMAGVFGFANLQLYFSSLDYFSSSAGLNPFTHLWSLGVEEQFYLLFPVLFFCLAGQDNSRPLIALISIVTIVSLFTFLISVQKNESFAFYMPLSRFWQICFGVLIYLNHRGIYHFAHRLLGDCSKNVIFVFLITFTMFFAPFFPFIFSTFFISLLVALLLVGAANSTSTRNIANNFCLTHIGKISYGLYLFHWPILVLLRWTVGVNVLNLFLALIITYLFAVLSFYFVEKKIRRQFSFNITPGHLYKLLSGMLLVFCLPILQFKILSVDLFLGARIDSSHVGVTSLLNPQIDSESQTWTSDACILKSNDDVGKKFFADDCIISSSDNPDKSKRRVLIIGNSFAASLFPMFNFKNSYIETSLIASWGASPTPSLDNDGPWSLSNQYYWKEVVPELTKTLNEGDLLFLASDLTSLSPGLADQSSFKSLAVFEKDMEKIIETLSKRNINVGLLGPTPFLREANCHPNMALNQWFAPNPDACTFYSLADTSDRLAALNAVIERLNKSGNFHVFTMLDDLCFNELCSFIDGNGTILYRDEFSHLSYEVAEKLRPSYLRWASNVLENNIWGFDK